MYTKKDTYIPTHACFLVFFSGEYFYTICAVVRMFIFCLTANVSIFLCLCLSLCVYLIMHILCVYVCTSVCVCLCVCAHLSGGALPWAVASSRPSDYCCLLHRQINPLNNSNPSKSLSFFLPSFSPSFSFIHTHSLIYSVETSYLLYLSGITALSISELAWISFHLQ